MQIEEDPNFYRIQLFISCRDLKNLDFMSKSDPICHVHVKKDTKQAFWTKFSSTEQVKDNLNPDFNTVIHCYYYFERHQPIRFEVNDTDGKGDFQVIGEADTTIGHIIGAPGQTFKADLKKGGAIQG